MKMRLLAVLVLAQIASAADEQTSLAPVRFHLRVHVGGSAPVENQLTVPLVETRRIAATASLTYVLETTLSPSGIISAGVGLEASDGRAFEHAMQFRAVANGEVVEVSFTVCGERVIRQSSISAKVAQCSDLPPMAKIDPRLDDCVECSGAYEGMPQRLGSTAQVAARDSVGESLVLTGRTLAPSGLPRRGVIVYAFQADSLGVYPEPDPPRSTLSQSHGTLRGWAMTDESGRYKLNTILPGPLRDAQGPSRIHMIVIEPGCATYMIDDTRLSDDPEFATGASASGESQSNKEAGGSGLVTSQRDGSTNLVTATRDIYLGRGIRNYPGCGS